MFVFFLNFFYLYLYKNILCCIVKKFPSLSKHVTTCDGIRWPLWCDNQLNTVTLLCGGVWPHSLSSLQQQTIINTHCLPPPHLQPHPPPLQCSCLTHGDKKQRSSVFFLSTLVFTLFLFFEIKSLTSAVKYYKVFKANTKSSWDTNYDILWTSTLLVGAFVGKMRGVFFETGSKVAKQM